MSLTTYSLVEMLLLRVVICCLFGLVKAHFEEFRYLVPRDNAVQEIVHGNAAEEGEVPWQLAFKRNGEFICGAALISPLWALTAAHCVDKAYEGLYSATGGELNFLKDSGYEVTRAVSSFIQHSNYNKTEPGFPNDIALIKFSRPFPVNDHIKPVVMASEMNNDFAGAKCAISGWGKLGEKSNVALTLQYAVMPVISNSECTTLWGHDVLQAAINPGHVCVYDSKEAICSGDSGGPLVCDGVLIGVTSWGVDTCSANFPSVYSRVSHYRAWIDTVRATMRL